MKTIWIRFYKDKFAGPDSSENFQSAFFEHSGEAVIEEMENWLKQYPEGKVEFVAL